MINNNDETPDNQYGLREVMTESERTAVGALIHETVSPDISADAGIIDSIFSVLAHPGRRYILTYLLCSDGYVTMSELVDYVMTETNHGRSGEPFREKVTVKLTNEHLPLLDEEGFVVYNMERQLIQPTQKTELVAPYLKIALLHRQRLAEASK